MNCPTCRGTVGHRPGCPITRPSARAEMRRRVAKSLDNAIENGYELDEWSAREIAEDVHEYDSQFEDVEPIELVPHVEAWKGHRAVTGRSTARQHGVVDRS